METTFHKGAKQRMKYRTLGRSGMRVSEIGLGCEGFISMEDGEAQEVFQAALNAGVNCMDLYSPNPDLRRRVRRALEGRREGFVLQGHFCSIWDKGQYRATREVEEVRRGFEDLLEELGTSYIDIGMIHYIDNVPEWKRVQGGPVMDYALEEKERGRAKCLGLSTHNPQVGLLAAESGLIDVLMFSVNPCYDLQPAGEDVEELWAEKNYAGQLTNMDPEREKLYETCQRLGVGITVMKAFGGGDLLSEYSPAGKALTAEQCIQYALDRPGVASVMSGVRSMGDLERSLHYMEAGEAERDYAAALASFPRIAWEGHCMYCGHCAPCPKEIDIAMVTKLLNLVRAQGEMPETVREHYAVLEHKAGECIQCGACEKRCPFQVEIRENMKEAARTFGK